MSSKLESDVCCRLQVAPSGERYEGKRRPGRKHWQTTARFFGVIYFTSPAGWLPVHRDQLRAQRSVTSMGKLYLFTASTFRIPRCWLVQMTLCFRCSAGRHWLVRSRKTSHREPNSKVMPLTVLSAAAVFAVVDTGLQIWCLCWL